MTKKYSVQRKLILPLMALISLALFSFCAEEDSVKAMTPPGSDVENGTSAGNTGEESFKITMTVNGHKLSATLYNNATTRAFIEKLPITLPMMDLYNREMCYRFPEALPTDDVNNCGYEVGEIVYYPPMHSFVILYEQNGEHFSMQKLGKMDSDVSFFDGIGDVDVTFEQEALPSGISETARRNTSVQAHGNKVFVDAEGQIAASLYAATGMPLATSSGVGRIELDAADYRGMAILDMNIDGERQNKKVILK